MLYISLRLRLYMVRGVSMEPTLFDGDVLLASSPRRSPRRGDIVIVRAPDIIGQSRAGRPSTGVGGEASSAWQVKRIVGLPGDSVSFESGLLFVNGERFAEPYLGGLPADVGTRSLSWRMGPDEILTLGDNRAHSVDGRRSGPAPLASIEGVVIARLWPVRRRRGRRSR